jgi:hypothetical protein
MFYNNGTAQAQHHVHKHPSVHDGKRCHSFKEKNLPCTGGGISHVLSYKTMFLVQSILYFLLILILSASHDAVNEFFSFSSAISAGDDPLSFDLILP